MSQNPLTWLIDSRYRWHITQARKRFQVMDGTEGYMVLEKIDLKNLKIPVTLISAAVSD